ncbi:MAG: thiamine pyrophosphate-dependent enzyme, partial [Pseudomonadota bacterium]
AYSDSVPVLCISSCLDETAARQGQLHQMLDQAGAARTVCDWSETATTAKAAYALIDRALMEFETMRSRPKHITVPISVLETPAPPPPGKDIYVSGASTLALQDLAQDILQAKRPLFIFGGGCYDLRDYKPREAYVRRLMRRTGAAAFMTYAARGVVSPDDPMSLGANLARPSSADVLAQADMLITFGAELGEGDLWRDTLGHDCHHVRIDIDPQVLAQHPRADEIILANTLDVFRVLLDHLPHTDAPPKWDAAQIAVWRAQWQADVAAERQGLLPIIKAVQAALPRHTTIYSDMTQFAYMAKEVWDMHHPGFWHHPTGFGTLGYALPAAIGGAVARPDLPVAAIAGDYGFQYTLQELGTAVELGLPLPIILWDNGKLKEIED